MITQTNIIPQIQSALNAHAKRLGAEDWAPLVVQAPEAASGLAVQILRRDDDDYEEADMPEPTIAAALEALDRLLLEASADDSPGADAIEAMAAAAEADGDFELAALCRHALAGNPDAWDECGRIERAAWGRNGG